MDFIDLKAQLSRIRPKIDGRIKNILDHGHFILGPEVQELETALAQYTRAKHCISCASGTDALLMPLMALAIGKGDAVFVPSFTFFATAEVIALVGATPVFVDIDPSTYTISPASLHEAIRTLPKKFPGIVPKAIIPVDLFGVPAQYDAIHAIAKSHALVVIEDAAQSFGANYKGEKAGALAEIAATSFFPAKPLGCYGDGGAIFCSDDQLAQKLVSIRVHGQGKDKYHNIRLGLNARLDTLQAGILIEKLAILDDEIKKREQIASRYTDALKNVAITPNVPSQCRSAWAQYTIQINNRDMLMDALTSKGIPSMLYYPVPLHLQDAFSHLNYKKGDLPISEQLSTTVISLPMHPYLSESDQDKVIKEILHVLR